MSQRFVAPACIVLAMMVLAFSDNFIWMIADRMSVWQYHALRSVMLLPLIAGALVLLGHGRSIRVKRPGAVAARATFTVTALMLYFAAIPAVGISLAAAGLFTSPVFVVLISILVFRERVGWFSILGMISGFAGVCLVLEIGTEPLRVMAIAPMIGGLLYGLNVIWTRRYCRQETPGALAFWNMAAFLVLGGLGVVFAPVIQSLMAGVEGAGFAAMAPRMPSAPELGIVALMGLAGATGMVLLAKGYSDAPSSFAALFDYSFLAWVPFFAWALRGETITTTMAIGIGLIVAAGSLAVLGGRNRSALADD